jgi:hypothetical protein
MRHAPRAGRIRTGVIVFTAVAAVSALTLGSAMALRQSSSGPSLPCKDGGNGCSHIGYTNAWFGGKTVQLEYSHTYFCAQPPISSASSGCEAGRKSHTDPPSGAVVSEAYAVVPMGFHPPARTLQCPVNGRCIDSPRTIDMSRVFGSGSADAVFAAHSLVIEEDESFQSTWWPLVVVGVKSLRAWNKIVAAKDIESVDACQAAGHCFPEAHTNAYLFFQVLGPGMGPQGPD